MMTQDTDTRGRILEAATARFRRFGFAKTTMAEIAADCGMSAANLYRYFRNKDEIVDGCAVACIAGQVDTLRRIMRRDGLTPAAKLERFTLELLENTYEFFSGEPQLAEVVSHLSRHRTDLIRDHKIGPMTGLIAEILAEGNRTGAFDVADVHQGARTLLFSLFIFHTPFLILTGMLDRAELEQLARDTVALLVRGLAAR